MGAKLSIDKKAMIHEQLVYYCRYGQIDNLFTLYGENPDIDLSYNEEEAFRVACEAGEIEVIRQLRIWNHNMNIGAQNYLGFCIAICYGHEEVIKQLFAWNLSLDPMRFVNLSFCEKTIELLKDIASRRKKIDWLYKVISNDLECPICQDIPGDIIKTPCNHYFCQKCISTWYEMNQSCPNCREKL